MSDSDEREAEARREFLQERARLVEKRDSQSAALDKTVLTLSSAALSLSVLFVDRIAPNPINDAPYLYASWVLFLIAIFFMTGSFLTSQFAFKRSIQILDGLYRRVSQDRTNRANQATMACTFLSLLSFFLGAATLLFFAAANINKSEDLMQNRNGATTQQDQRGLTSLPPAPAPNKPASDAESGGGPTKPDQK